MGRVQLSRQVLSYSNQNSRLTLQIFLSSNKDEIQPLLWQRAKNVEKISSLVDRVEAEGFGSEREKELFDAVKRARTPYVDSYRLAQDLYVSKPIRTSELFAAIERATGKSDPGLTHEPTPSVPASSET
jgi:hypothetical protein